MFRILDYLDDCEVIENTNTQVTIRCPVCDNKIRISKRTSAYFCTANCDTKEIRSALNVPVFTRSDEPSYTPIRPIECPPNIELHPVSGTFPLEESVYFSSNPLDEQKVKRTVYVYDDHHKIVRIDQLVTKTKRFYPLHWNGYEWITEAGEKHPLLNEGYICDPSKFVVFVEGEKCAIELSRIGILGLSPASFGWAEQRLKKSLERILYSIRGVVAIPDNDDPGWKKMTKLQQVCWTLGLPCRILNLTAYYTKPKDDVADLIQRNIDVYSLLTEKVRLRK
jgi:hypothetical protein